MPSATPGHDVLIAIPEAATGLVLDAGHEAWALPQADAAVGDAPFARARAAASQDEAAAIVVGELFAGTYARAALPGVMAAVAEWLPDVIMHETCEFAGALTAERAGLPSVRVAVHMRELEGYVAAFAARHVDGLRAEHGLAADPEGVRLLGGRSVTLTPPALDGGRREFHYREPQVPLAMPPGRWNGDERPLVYVSYGTVAPQGDAYPAIYREPIEQLATSTCGCSSTRAARIRRSWARCPRASTPSAGCTRPPSSPTWRRWCPTPAPAACARRSRPACRSRSRPGSATSR